MKPLTPSRTTCTARINMHGHCLDYFLFINQYYQSVQSGDYDYVYDYDYSFDDDMT